MPTFRGEEGLWKKFRAEELATFEALCARARLPVGPPADMPKARFHELMAVDKKVQDGRLRLVLLQGIGAAVVTGAFERAALDETLDAYAA